MQNLTPMLRQYYQLKNEYPGCILLFRLGDFYEMFDDDAKLASRLLEITLTSREAGKGRRIPMCGVPHHSVESYIALLVAAGYKVAICEQVEDPRTAKGVVRREVVRVVTPGTVLEAGMLKERENNFLVAVTRREARRPGPERSAPAPSDGAWQESLLTASAADYGLAVCDLSTGEFTCTQIEGERALAVTRDEISRLSPAELLFEPAFGDPRAAFELETLSRASDAATEVLAGPSLGHASARRRLLEHFRVESLEGFGCEHLELAVRAAAIVLDYLSSTQKGALGQITRLSTYSTASYMMLDQATRRNLELTRTLRSQERKGSLLWVLDKTKTAMGGRLMRHWIERPLLDAGQIQRRLDAVQDLVDDGELRAGVQEILSSVHDIQRLTGRIAHGSAGGRDLVALKNSLAPLPRLKELIETRAKCGTLKELAAALDPCGDIREAIEAALVDDPPVTVTEGGLIRPGYNRDLDELRTASREGKEWIAALERKERERTNIRSLKVGFNKVFGYYIEVTKPNLPLVPPDYERKQTLANAERFVTPELKEKEAMILGAEERMVELEYRLFVELRSKVAGEASRLQRLAEVLAELDVYASWAETAVERGYVRPEVDHGDVIEIKAGRHAVVEAMLEPGAFVPNDLRLDPETQIILLTGPNMAGKSTYLRQAALTVLMAQIGCFVPAQAARIGIVDRIFTRVGASDDLATGQSTFMVEMNEVANILNHATAKSLVILDEVGRGTSTFDGLSIAWAVTEYLHNHETTRPKTLFATHYHELTELEGALPRVKNYSVAVHRQGGEVVFLRRIVRGGADQSYGIEVAKLAGLPAEVIERAREILRHLEAAEAARWALEAAAAADGAATSGPGPSRVRRPRGLEGAALQLSLFDTASHPIVQELAALDVDAMTPLQALNVLARFVQRAREGEP
ncbi:MAG: DNA mismatch repair protein MutS [Firmicutes bacterium]|nr:DNA mismatch repair protein MutS [Bacillota bacterium]